MIELNPLSPTVELTGIWTPDSPADAAMVALNLAALVGHSGRKSLVIDANAPHHILGRLTDCNRPAQTLSGAARLSADEILSHVQTHAAADVLVSVENEAGHDSADLEVLLQVLGPRYDHIVVLLPHPAAGLLGATFTRVIAIAGASSASVDTVIDMHSKLSSQLSSEQLSMILVDRGSAIDWNKVSVSQLPLATGVIANRYGSWQAAIDERFVLVSQLQDSEPRRQSHDAAVEIKENVLALGEAIENVWGIELDLYDLIGWKSLLSSLR